MRLAGLFVHSIHKPGRPHRAQLRSHRYTDFRLGSAGEVFVPSGISPLIFFSSTAHDLSAKMHSIHLSSGTQSVQMDANLSPSCLLQLEVPAGRSTLWVDDHELLAFSTYGRTNREVENKCVDVFYIDQKGESASCPFHAKSAQKIFENIRLGKIQLVTFAIPDGVFGHISWRSRSELNWQQRDVRAASSNFDSSLGKSTVDSQVIETITEAVSNSTIDVIISFSGFGSVVLLADAATRTVRRLPLPLKGKLVWALQRAGRFAGHSKVSDASDVLLVQMFEQTRAPLHLVPQWRALSEQLKKFSS